MKRRRFLRRMKLPVLLPLGFIGLALALWGIEHWAPAGALGRMIAAATAERSPGPAADHNRQAPRATEFVGRVVGIADGDTLTVLMAERDEVRVRLAEIDAPEATQPFGARAKQVLSSLAFGRTARVSVVDTDQYGRTVARLYVGTLDVNAEMVRQGAAWVYVRYSRDPVLPGLEREAQRMRLGLWALPQAERMPPWEWRQLRRE
jgi:endonuclease YncB( thermonuclease family)